MGCDEAGFCLSWHECKHLFLTRHRLCDMTQPMNTQREYLVDSGHWLSEWI